MYCSNFDIFVKITGLLEQSPAGDVRPSAHFSPFPLTMNWWIFTSDLVIFLYTIWYTYAFVYGVWWATRWMGSFGFYLWNFWNLLDLVLALSNYAIFGLKLSYLFFDGGSRDFYITTVSWSSCGWVQY